MTLHKLDIPFLIKYFLIVIVALAAFSANHAIALDQNFRLKAGEAAKLANDSKYYEKLLEKHTEKELKQLYYNYVQCQYEAREMAGEYTTRDTLNNLMLRCDKMLENAGLNDLDRIMVIYIGAGKNWPRPQ